MDDIDMGLDPDTFKEGQIIALDECPKKIEDKANIAMAEAALGAIKKGIKMDSDEFQEIVRAAEKKTYLEMDDESND